MGRTAGDCSLNNLKNYHNTYKKHDNKINAIVTERYWMSGAFMPTHAWGLANYFWNSTLCKYNHNGISRGSCNCVAERPDMVFRRQCGYPHGGHYGIGDWGGRHSELRPDRVNFDGDRYWGSNDCLHTSHSSGYWYLRRAG